MYKCNFVKTVLYTPGLAETNWKVERRSIDAKLKQHRSSEREASHAASDAVYDNCSNPSHLDEIHCMHWSQTGGRSPVLARSLAMDVVLSICACAKHTTRRRNDSLYSTELSPWQTAIRLYTYKRKRCRARQLFRYVAVASKDAGTHFSRSSVHPSVCPIPTSNSITKRLKVKVKCTMLGVKGQGH